MLRSGGIGALTTTVTPTEEATLLLSKGVHPKVVQELLGHATITTTIQKYKTLQPSLPSLTSRWRRRAFNIIESLKEGDVARPFPVNR